ncbi:hypothetical protein EXIGLDRAFT_834762 [Exidia glandulosa HHB12029]|uniref:Uncharacterized protein n=1 Tax=Exidia glandulosa HHB12029 TaxID=1314781 RepID=A0A165JG70_EXIGL|nr:hypothetical protein EXIGLDRAFT_834762 [Exidia glandulosa HHB12029]
MDFQFLPTRISDNVPCIFVVRGTLYTDRESEMWTLISTLNAIERTHPKLTPDAEDGIIRLLRDNGFDPEVGGILLVEEYSKRAFRAVFEYTPGVDTKGIMSLRSLSIPFRLDTIRKQSRALLVFDHVVDLRIHFIGDIPLTIQETLTSLDRHLNKSVLFPMVTTLSLSFSKGKEPATGVLTDIQQLKFAPTIEHVGVLAAPAQVLVREFEMVSLV